MTTTNDADFKDGKQYENFLTWLREHFTAVTADNPPLFTTDASGLYDLVLGALPLEARQVYDCNSCRMFVETYGNLVCVRPGEGTAYSPFWDDSAGAPTVFAPIVAALARAVAKAKINGVFLTEESTWGLAANTSSIQAKRPGIVWHHMAVTPPAGLVYQATPDENAGQRTAKLREEHTMLCTGLAEFPLDIIQKAATLLANGEFHGKGKALPVAQWLVAVQTARVAAHRDVVGNLMWLAVACAPTHFCHVRSGLIGTVLEDVQNGLPVDEIKRRFEAKMPGYMRPTAAPTAGALAVAEKLIAELKAADALDRRFAKIDDIPASQFLWRPQPAKSPSAPAGGLFAHIATKPKASTVLSTPMVLPERTMTWHKFVTTVLPDVQSIEARVPTSSDRFMALVTAAKPEARRVLQWDSDENPNPVSWFYHGGIDPEIRRRVVAAGGMHEGCDIRVSLIWGNHNDLDIHVWTPRNEHVFYAQPKSSCGGWLDVDMNRSGETDKPVENIRWRAGTARAGRYRVVVQNYAFHRGDNYPTPFQVEIEVEGDVFHFAGVASPHGRETGSSSDIVVAEFTYFPGQKLSEPPRGLRTAAPQPGGAVWNLTAGQWAKVTGVVMSPNLWGEHPLKHHGEHTFLLLEQCKDASSGLGRGFFVETLRKEYHEIRRVLEAYNATAVIAGAEEATACGLGMPGDGAWDLVLRVTSKTGDTQVYKIDRRD